MQDERKASAKSEATSSTARYLLPRDLPRALTQLDDSEIDALLTAVTDESKRRGRLPPETSATTTPKPEPARVADKAARAGGEAVPMRLGRMAGGARPPSLTLGQANAVRAAFMAGVKPSTIARQFGISQTAVRQAIAGDQKARRS